MEREYEGVLQPAEEGGYAVFVPGMRGCVSQGETEEEALENIRDAIQCWLDSWEEIEGGESGRRASITPQEAGPCKAANTARAR